jgi:hypothetical protein
VIGSAVNHGLVKLELHETHPSEDDGRHNSRHFVALSTDKCR